jgi:hypothetical protein
MSQLLPCPACHRHVDTNEAACPFCGVVLPEAFRAGRPLVPPPRRLGRAALMAAGATLVGAAACSGNDAIGNGPMDAAMTRTTGTGGESVVAAYGAPLPTGGTSGTAGSTGAGGSVATGGTSGSTDSGTDAATDAGEKPGDAGRDRGVIAIYGAAPFPTGPSTIDPGKPDPQS